MILYSHKSKYLRPPFALRVREEFLSVPDNTDVASDLRISQSALKKNLIDFALDAHIIDDVVTGVP